MALLMTGPIGGFGGSAFTYHGAAEGRTLQRIRVFAARNCIKAIALRLSDGQERTFGNPARSSDSGAIRNSEFIFRDNERVTSLSLWGNGIGTRAGWIRFQTTLNRRFDYGMYRWGQQTEFPQSVGSGIFMGMRGRAGEDVDSLGAIFLNPIRSIHLVDVNYPTMSTLPQSTINSIPSSTKSFQLANTENPSASTQQLAWELADQPSFQVRHQWLVSTPSFALWQFIATVPLAVQARTPAVAVLNNAIRWQISASDVSSPSLSSSPTLPLPWSRSGFTLPSSSVTVTAVPYVGQANNLSFNGRARVTTTNGSRLDVTGLNGVYNGNSYVISITGA